MNYYLIPLIIFVLSSLFTWALAKLANMTSHSHDYHLLEAFTRLGTICVGAAMVSALIVIGQIVYYFLFVF